MTDERFRELTELILATDRRIDGWRKRPHSHLDLTSAVWLIAVALVGIAAQQLIHRGRLVAGVLSAIAALATLGAATRASLMQPQRMMAQLRRELARRGATVDELVEIIAALRGEQRAQLADFDPDRLTRP